jgi:dienelactone hydrolase
MRRLADIVALGALAALGVAVLGARPAAARTDPPFYSVCDLPSGASAAIVHYIVPADYEIRSPLCSGTFCSMRGFLYAPAGAGPFPAIVLSHSAGKVLQEADFCAIVEYFLRKGFVVFEPGRRGVRFEVAGGTNTGELPSTTLDLIATGRSSESSSAEVYSLLIHCGLAEDVVLDADSKDCVNAGLQSSQVREIIHAIDFIKGLSAVDPARIALMGHAEGANITAMAARFDAGQKAAVLLSPAGLSWDSDHPYLIEALMEAVRLRKSTIAILQPSNGDVKPTEDLANAAIQTMDYQFMASLLPAVEGTDLTAELIQRRFATRAKEVKQWGAFALRFMIINFEK